MQTFVDTDHSHPLVSIVVATYNGERFLDEQLDSLLRQTYEPLEIVVVDDCSSDGTMSILDRYAALDARVRVFRNPHNLGFQKNFERGFLLARGEYIAPCDQDDIWGPDKIEVLIRNRGSYGITYCDSEFIDGTGASLGQKMSEWKTLADFDDPINFAVGASVPGHAMLIKKSLIADAIPFPPCVTHDYWLGFVATLQGPLKFVAQPLVLYRRHDGNLFGALKTQGRWHRRRQRRNRAERESIARQRVQLLYEKCPDNLVEAKHFYATVVRTYQSYSLPNNLTRMLTFFRYRRAILAFKKRSELRRVLFSVKMFFTIV